MKNPTRDWLKDVDFQIIDISEFPTDRNNEYYFNQWVEGIHYALVYERGKSCYFISKAGDIINNGLIVLHMYKEILAKKNNIKSIIIPGVLSAYDGKNILPLSQTVYILNNASNSAHYQKMIQHYPVDVYKYNNQSVEFSAAVNYLTALFYMKPYIRVPYFYKGDLKTAWNHLSSKKGSKGLIARNGINYKIRRK